MDNGREVAACTPIPLQPRGFNTSAQIPYGCTIEHIRLAMQDFIDFLAFINTELHTNELPRLESMLMPANFSSIVGEFMLSTIPRYCRSIVKNRYHNGHPDLIPVGRFANNSIQHTSEGIEVKASRYLKGWQGHNPENIWLMVFVFDSNRPVDPVKDIAPKPFQFLQVLGAMLTEDDWTFSGRSEISRRTITASVLQSGHEKMADNWIYKDPDSFDR